MKRSTFFLLLVSILSASASFATDKEKEALKSKIDNILKWEEQFGFSGSVLVVKEGKIILNKGYGFANKSHYQFNSPKTAFYIASVSKPLTALAVMKLVEEKRINLKDPITKYFPNVPDKKKGITLDMLLSHTSGMQQTYSCDKIADRALAIETILSKTPMMAEPGVKYIYSGDGYTLLAALIEIVTQYKFETYVTENIFTPAGIRTPAFTGKLSLLKHEDIASPVASSSFASLREVPATWGKKGRAGMVLSVEDIYKIDAALQGNKIFKTNIIEDILSPKIKITTNTNYGYGFNVFTTIRGTRGFGHGGDDDDLGHNFNYINFQDEKIKIFIASNSGLYAGSSWSTVISSLIQKMLFPSNYIYPADKLFHTEFINFSTEKIEKFEGVYQSGNTSYQVFLNEQQLYLCPVGNDAAAAVGFSTAYSSKNELSKSILEETYNKQYTLLENNSPDKETFELLKKTFEGLWASLEKNFGKLDHIQIMGTANVWGGSLQADIGTWIKMHFKNRTRIYRMEWDVNHKISGLGGGAIPFPMIFRLNAIAKGEFIGFDAANARTMAVNFLAADKDNKPIMELNIGENKPLFLNNTGEMSLLPKRSAAELLYRIITTKGIAAAREEVTAIKEGKLSRFDVDEGEFNDYGYQLLKEKKFDEAIALFTITVEAFPESANAFDSLAEAYMKAGNKTEAIKYYKKVLELNPKSQDAKNMIEKLSN